MGKFNIKKININIISLGILTLIVIAILTIYNIIKPNNYKPGYNFSSFPNIGPRNLPPGISSSKNCNISIQECPDGSCEKCGNDNFVCTTLTDKDPQHYFTNKNGVKIPIPKNKKVCIPDTSNVDRGTTDCNTYTGSWVWTTSNNCPKGGQCWTCSCNYPDLFGDETKGCAEPFACQSNIISQNKLVLTIAGAVYLNSKHGTTYKGGEVYDPKSGKDNTLLGQNPYDVDGNNNPLFSCNCVAETTVGGKIQAQIKSSLPGDPFTCHTDRCWPGNNNSSAIVNGDQITCDCKGGVTIGPTTGTERTTDRTGLCQSKTFCGAGGTNCSTGGQCNDTSDCTQCVCSGTFKQRKCNSSLVTWPTSGGDPTPQCCKQDNPIGYECWDNCNPNNCAPWLECVNGSCDCPVKQAPDLAGTVQTLKSKKNYVANKCEYSWPAGTKILDGNFNWLTNPDTGPCGGTCDPSMDGCKKGCNAGKCCESGAIIANGAEPQFCNSATKDQCCTTLLKSGDCCGILFAGNDDCSCCPSTHHTTGNCFPGFNRCD